MIIDKKDNKFRMKVANCAMYHANCPNTPYSVYWGDIMFHDKSPAALVDQVIDWINSNQIENMDEIKA